MINDSFKSSLKALLYKRDADGTLKIKDIIEINDNSQTDPNADDFVHLEDLHQKWPKVLIFCENEDEVVNIIKSFQDFLDHVDSYQDFKILPKKNEDDVLNQVSNVYAFVYGGKADNLKDESRAYFGNSSNELNPSCHFGIEQIIVKILQKYEFEVHIEK